MRRSSSSEEAAGQWSGQWSGEVLHHTSLRNRLGCTSVTSHHSVLDYVYMT